MNGGCDACHKRAAPPPGAFAHLTNTQIPPMNGSTISSAPERKPARAIHRMATTESLLEEYAMEHHEPFAALSGIDWSDRQHDLCFVNPATGNRELSVISHTPEARNEWARSLRARFGGARVAICLEQSRGSLIYAVLQ